MKITLDIKKDELKILKIALAVAVLHSRVKSNRSIINKIRKQLPVKVVK